MYAISRSCDLYVQSMNFELCLYTWQWVIDCVGCRMEYILDNCLHRQHIAIWKSELCCVLKSNRRFLRCFTCRGPTLKINLPFINWRHALQQTPSTALHHCWCCREILVVNSHNACDLTDACAIILWRWSNFTTMGYLQTIFSLFAYYGM